MRLNYLLLLTVFIFIIGNNSAQITITSTDLPNIGDIFIYDNSQDLLFEDFTPTGTNYSWDYSSGTSSQVDSVYVVSVGSTPLAYQYFFNNQWTEPDHYSDYAQPGLDFSFQGQVSIEDRYDFFGVNSNSLEIKGFGANINGIPASVKYDTIDQVYPLPMTYGMAAHNSVGYYLASIPNLGTYGQWIRREVSVDGYGSLITPNATYSNTIRVKTVLLQTDTIYVDQFMFGQTFDRPEETIYEWFTNTEKTPVMRVVYRNAQATEVKYLLDITSGTVEFQELSVELVTEDPKGKYQLTGIEGQESVVVYNSMGQIVGNFYSAEIEILDQPSGVYFLVLRKDNHNHCFKVVK